MRRGEWQEGRNYTGHRVKCVFLCVYVLVALCTQLLPQIYVFFVYFSRSISFQTLRLRLSLSLITCHLVSSQMKSGIITHIGDYCTMMQQSPIHQIKMTVLEQKEKCALFSCISPSLSCSSFIHSPHSSPIPLPPPACVSVCECDCIHGRNT